MKNKDLQRGIEFEMRRVPRFGPSWRYIPLKGMPVGTEIWFDATNTPTPGELESRIIPVTEGSLEDVLFDQSEEKDVLRLPAGRYGLRVGETSAITLIYPDGSEEAVRPLYNLISPTSCFQANVERVKEKREHPDDTWTTTFRLTTGMIDAIFIPGTRFNLTLSEAEKIDPFPLMKKAGECPNDYHMLGEFDVRN